MGAVRHGRRRVTAAALHPAVAGAVIGINLAISRRFCGGGEEVVIDAFRQARAHNGILTGKPRPLLWNGASPAAMVDWISQVSKARVWRRGFYLGAG